MKDPKDGKRKVALLLTHLFALALIQYFSSSIAKVMCRSCDSKDGITAITIPYVFRYLVNELAAMNIRITMNIHAE